MTVMMKIELDSGDLADIQQVLSCYVNLLKDKRTNGTDVRAMRVQLLADRVLLARLHDCREVS